MEVRRDSDVAVVISVAVAATVSCVTARDPRRAERVSRAKCNRGDRVQSENAMLTEYARRPFWWFAFVQTFSMHNAGALPHHVAVRDCSPPTTNRDAALRTSPAHRIRWPQTGALILALAVTAATFACALGVTAGYPSARDTSAP